ncbi:MAG: hypothetical protein ACI8VT_002596 [Saprospiraceae bacterium]
MVSISFNLKDEMARKNYKNLVFITLYSIKTLLLFLAKGSYLLLKISYLNNGGIPNRIGLLVSIYK